MPPERPAPRPGPRRAIASPTKIPSGPPIGKFLPYIVAGLLVAGLVFLLIKVPRYASFGAMGIMVVVSIACGWLAMSARPSLKPDDSLRTLLPIVTVLALGAALVPFGYTIFPPAPRGEIRLAADGDSGTIDVTGMASTTWVTVSGRFAPAATGAANYFLSVEHNGHTERVDGTFRPHPGGPEPERHVLQTRGTGRYVIRLEQVSSAIAMPLTVALSAKPFTTILIILLFASLGVGVLALDTMLYRRGVEPAVAASLLFPMVAAIYFQRNPASNTLTTDLLAAGVIGLLGGGIGGELLARVVRAIVPK